LALSTCSCNADVAPPMDGATQGRGTSEGVPGGGRRAVDRRLGRVEENYTYVATPRQLAPGRLVPANLRKLRPIRRRDVNRPFPSVCHKWTANVSGVPFRNGNTRRSRPATRAFGPTEWLTRRTRRTREPDAQFSGPLVLRVMPNRAEDCVQGKLPDQFFFRFGMRPSHQLPAPIPCRLRRCQSTLRETPSRRAASFTLPPTSRSVASM